MTTATLTATEVKVIISYTVSETQEADGIIVERDEFRATIEVKEGQTLTEAAAIEFPLKDISALVDNNPDWDDEF